MQDVKDKVEDISESGSKVYDTVQDMKDKAKDKLDESGRKAKDTMQDMKDSVETVGQKAIHKVEDALKSVEEKLYETGSAAFQKLKNKVKIKLIHSLQARKIPIMSQNRKRKPKIPIQLKSRISKL